MTDQITCAGCRESKDRAEFHKARGRKSGLTSYCKPCGRKLALAWRSKAQPKPERTCVDCGLSGGVDLFYGLDACCKECKKVRNKRWADKNVERIKARRVHSSYGVDFYAEMERQDSACAICGDAENGGKRLSVDHDHSCCPGVTSCGKCFRGLLCSRCNLVLGRCEDDPHVFRAMADYLEDRR